MAKFSFGDWREMVGPVHIIDDQGNIIGLSATPLHITGTVVIGASEDDTQVFTYDDTTGALVGIDVPHHEIHEGESHLTSYKTPDASPLGDNATLAFAMTTGAKECHIIASGAMGGDMEGEFYEGTTYTGGQPQAIFNKKRSAWGGATATVVRDPTVTNAGTLLENRFVPGGTGPNAVGGAGGQRDEWILAPSTVYLFRLTNRSGANQPASLVLEWYEEDVG